MSRMSRRYTSSPPSAFVAYSGTALAFIYYRKTTGLSGIRRDECLQSKPAPGLKRGVTKRKKKRKNVIQSQ
jgi:hypothetical protein